MKLIKIFTSATVMLSVITISLWIIGMNWNTLNHGIIHNLFAITSIGTVMVGGILICLLLNESLKNRD